MADRTELLEAALDSFPEGLALLDMEGQLIVWNRAAEAITGYTSLDLVGRSTPAELKTLLGEECLGEKQELCVETRTKYGRLIRLTHKLGHQIPVMMRTMLLRDGLGERIGLEIAFHPSGRLDALPHGDCSEEVDVETDRAEFEDRLTELFEDFQQGGETFGVLWIAVDQAPGLRKTHGSGACELMLGKVERTLAHGLRPAEEMARWGDDEFLVLSHERTPKMLAAHAQLLAGLTRTADFRWWGDRVSLTVSIGAAQAKREESLADLLERARNAMLTSFHAGGNQITSAPGGPSCSPS
jgi:PAS domain S-box-containing protein/diguanylate cyclase (GGDEF)-like protein